MSFEFSRRNFLKYSAVAAVAVAGAGLFSGCDIITNTNDVYSFDAGELTVLQVTAAMGTQKDDKYTAPDLTGTTITFPMKITNGRANPIAITPYNFKVTISSKDGKTVKKFTGAGGKLAVSNALCDTNLTKGNSVSGDLVLTLTDDEKITESGATVTLTYCPDIQYTEYSMNWKLTRA